MTKATVTTVATSIVSAVTDPNVATMDIDAIHAMRDQKLAEMVAAEKTNGQQSIITPAVTSREWINTEAAEEWKTFCLAVDAQYGPGIIVSVDIVDV